MLLKKGNSSLWDWTWNKKIKILLYNQQTKARKYKFSNPTEGLEGKSARQCRACSWEDKSILYLFLHKREITDEGETGFPAEGWGSVEMFFPYHKKPWNTQFKRIGFSQNNEVLFYSNLGVPYLNMEEKRLSLWHHMKYLLIHWWRKIDKDIRICWSSFSEERFWGLLGVSSE